MLTITAKRSGNYFLEGNGGPNTHQFSDGLDRFERDDLVSLLIFEK